MSADNKAIQATMQRVDTLAKFLGTQIEGETPVGFWALPILEVVAARLSTIEDVLANHKQALEKRMTEINMLKARVADLEQQRG